MSRFLRLVLMAVLLPVATFAQIRKDDIVVRDTAGLGGAQVRVCTSAGSGTPCTPLATIYSDRGMTTQKSNPFSTDSKGNYNFYAPPGRYFVQIITGTSTLSMPDVLLPNDPGSGFVTGFSSVSYSSTMTFDSALATIYTVTLTGNVTSSSVTNASSGRILVFDICQDSTGGRTFSWPSNFVDPPQILGGASQCTTESFFYDSSSWRRMVTSDLTLSGTFVPGVLTGTITNPATAPTCAVDATSGGSFDNTTRYFRVILGHYYNGAVGKTAPSPACTLTPSTCGGGACTISVNVAGNEWRGGAEHYYVVQCSDSASVGSCHLRSGFNGELSLGTGAHYSPGTIILTTSDLTGAVPSSSNTTTIGADQVELNKTCNNFASSAYCYGTLQYKQNPVGGYTQTGLGPLVVSGVGARIQGHAVSNLDDASAGSTRNCAFTSTELGCVMVMNTNSVKIDGLGVRAAGSHGYMLHTWGSSFNQIEISNATVITSGTNAIAPLRIKGIWYYLRFPNLQLMANTTGTGSNRGAGMLVSNASGANWKASGPVRWTIRDNNDAIRNDVGFTDIDHGNSTSFPTMVGEFKLEDVQIQWGPTGSGQGVLISGVGLVPQFNRVSHSDYGPSAGAPAFIQIGADANGAAACCTNAFFSNSPALSAHTNNAAFVKLNSNSGSAFGQLKLLNMNMARPIDLNNLTLGGGLDIESTSNNSTSNYCNSASSLIVNAPATQPITCKYPVNNGIAANRIANYRFTGSLGFFSDGDGTKQRHFYWSGNDNLEFTYGSDPTTNANRIWQSIGSNGKFIFLDRSSGPSTALEIDAPNKAIGIGRSADINSALVLTNNRRIAATNNAGSAFVTLMFLDTSDRMVIGGSGTTIIPTATGTSDFGASSLRWNNGYFNGDLAFANLVMSGRTFDWTNASSPRLTMTDPTTPVTYREEITGDNNARIGTTTAHPLNFFTTDTDRWRVDASGHWLAVTDNVNDIGASGATRPRTLYTGTSVVTPALSLSGQLTSTLATGTSPFVIASTTEVANLNVQKWHSKDAIDFSAALDFGSISAQTCSTLTITATGAVADNPIAPSWPAALEAGLVGMMHVTANDTVTVRLCNVTTGAIDPASRTYAGRVIK